MPKEKPEEMRGDSQTGVPDHVIGLTGTSPLSYDVRPGSVLSIREFHPSNKSRPTVGAGFKNTAYVVFSGITKVGQVNKKDLPIFSTNTPRKCLALEVNREKNIFLVGVFL